MRNRARIYTTSLSILGLLSALSFGLILFLVETSAGTSVDTLLPEWSLPWVAIINLAYALAIFVTLCARRFRPETGSKLTRILNWALLPAVPVGTFVGIFGILLADKE